MNLFKSLKRRGNALYVILILIIIIAILGFLIFKFGLGDGGEGDGGGGGKPPVGPEKPPTTTGPQNPPQPPVPPQPPIPLNPSKLILEWRNPDDFRDIETKINNQLKPEARKVIIRTKVMKVTTAIEEKLIELIKNKGSEAELEIEQLK